MGGGEGKVGRGGEEREGERRGEGKGKIVPPNVRNALTPLPTCHTVKIVLHINR